MRVGVERVANTAHQPFRLRFLPVLHAAQEHGEEVILRLHQFSDAAFEWLHHDHFGLHVACAVGDVDHPVDKGAQEVAIADLQDAQGRFVGNGRCRDVEFSCGQIAAIE